MFIFFYLPFVLVAHVGLIGILCLIIWAETSFTYMRMYLLLLSILLYVLKFNNTPICYYFMHFRLYYSVSQVPKGNMIHQILFPDPVFCFTDIMSFVGFAKHILVHRKVAVSKHYIFCIYFIENVGTWSHQIFVVSSEYVVKCLFLTGCESERKIQYKRNSSQ